MNEDIIDYRPTSTRNNEKPEESLAYSNQGFNPRSGTSRVEECETKHAENGDEESLEDEQKDTVSPLEHQFKPFSRACSAESQLVPLVCLLRVAGEKQNFTDNFSLPTEGQIRSANNFGQTTTYESSGRRLSNLSVAEFLASDSMRATINAQRNATSLIQPSPSGRRYSMPVDITMTSKMCGVFGSNQDSPATTAASLSRATEFEDVVVLGQNKDCLPGE